MADNQAGPSSSASQEGASQIDLMPEFEREMQRTASPLPETPVTGFTCSLLLTPARIAPDDARNRLLTELKNAKASLPRGPKAERIVETLRPVLVPMWLIAGSIYGKWSATGIAVKTWEEECPKCYGSGKDGDFTQKVTCQNCWGTGKIKQTQKSKQTESGEATAEIQEFIDNNGTGVSLALELNGKAPPRLVTPDERARLQCLRPASIYHAAIADVVKNRLAASLDEKAKAALPQYDRVDNIQFVGDSVKSQYDVSAWLYPAYVCGFESGSQKHFVVCDAVTGKVTLPRSDNAATPAGSKGKESSKTKFVVIALVALIALGIAGWFAKSKLSGSAAKLPAAATQPATATPPSAPAAAPPAQTPAAKSGKTKQN